MFPKILFLLQDLLGYCEKSDIYSLGIVICELANGEVPYSRAEEATFMFLEKFEGVKPFIYDATTYEEYFENGDSLSKFIFRNKVYLIINIFKSIYFKMKN